MNDEILKDLPQLIVALDNNDDASNYIHIKDVKEDVVYYCPCCKGIVKPRAYKTGTQYKMQPHFYHTTGGCSEESYIHYICKNWLFEAGSQFIVNGETYSVKNIEVEKILHTQFGNYKPDIIVTTACGKIFYFEIKNTNKKTELYAPKWDELGNDVVEVDTRYFLNQKCDNQIPEFKLIYSDGNCFIKTYTRKDYDDLIAKRKLEWKRQDKLNYKMQWEKIDWFWVELQNCLDENSNVDNLAKAFTNINFQDMEFCLEIIKHHKKLKSNIYKFESILNKCFDTMAETYGIKMKQSSPMIWHTYNLVFALEDKFFVYDSHEYKKKLDVKKYSNLSEILNLSLDTINEKNISEWTNIGKKEIKNILNSKLDNVICEYVIKNGEYRMDYIDTANEYKSYSLDGIKSNRITNDLYKQSQLFIDQNISLIDDICNRINSSCSKKWGCKYEFSPLRSSSEMSWTLCIIIRLGEEEDAVYIHSYDDHNAYSYDYIVQRITKVMNNLLNTSGLGYIYHSHKYYGRRHLGKKYYDTRIIAVNTEDKA